MKVFTGQYTSHFSLLVMCVTLVIDLEVEPRTLMLVGHRSNQLIYTDYPFTDCYYNFFFNILNSVQLEGRIILRIVLFVLVNFDYKLNYL